MASPGWIYNPMSKEDAEALLKKHDATNGHYLLRQHKPGSKAFVMALIFKDRPTHHLMKQDESTKSWVVNNKSYGSFKTLKALMDALQGPLKGWPIVLTKGIVDAGHPAARKGGSIRKRSGSTRSLASLPDTLPETAEEYEKQLASVQKRLETIEAALGKATTHSEKLAKELETASGPDSPDYLWTEPVSREDAEARLQGTPDGTFFVRKRPGKEGSMIASISFRSKPTHHLLALVDGIWTINNKAYGQFSHVAELFDALSRPMNGWPVVLNAPIPDPSKTSVDVEATQATKEKADRAIQNYLKQRTETTTFLSRLENHKPALAPSHTPLPEPDNTPEVQPATATPAPVLATHEPEQAAVPAEPATTVVETVVEPEVVAEVVEPEVVAEIVEPLVVADPAPPAAEVQEQPLSVPVHSKVQPLQPSAAPVVSNVAVPVNESSTPYGTTIVETAIELAPEQPATIPAQSSATQAWSAQSDHQQKPAGAVSRSPPATMVIGGRQGHASFINGKYEEDVTKFYDGKPVFKHHYVIQGEQQPITKVLYLFYHKVNGAWAISQQLGDRDIAAFVTSQAERPEDIRGVWQVATDQRTFEEDRQVQVGNLDGSASSFQRLLSSNSEVNFFQCKLTSQQFVELCLELRAGSCSIQRLKLFENALTKAQAMELIESVEKNTSVTHLQIRNNGLDDDVADRIARMLHNNTTLKLLSLRGNNIGNEGAKWIAEAVRTNRALVGLSMRENEFSDEGLERFSDAMVVNTTLRGLALYDNRYKLSLAKRLLKKVLKRNRSCSFEVRNPTF